MKVITIISKIIIIILVFCFLFSNLCSAIESNSQLQFTVESTNKLKIKSDKILLIPLTFHFINCSNTDIKILNLFQPIPAFFNIQVEKENGEIYGMTPGMNISCFYHEVQDTILLESGEKHSLLLDLNSVLTSDDFLLKMTSDEAQSKGVCGGLVSYRDVYRKITPGKYIIKINYKARYGKDTITGIFKADPIEIEIK